MNMDEAIAILLDSSENGWADDKRRVVFSNGETRRMQHAAWLMKVRGMTYGGIAEQLGITRAAAERRVYKIRKFLMINLEISGPAVRKLEKEWSAQHGEN